MSADANTGKIPRCAVQRFVAKGASEQCLLEPHELTKTKCSFASDATRAEIAALRAEIAALRAEIARLSAP